MVLVSPEGHKLNCAVRFGFKATNNVGEYEALLSSLRLVKKMQMRRLVINNNYQFGVSQVNGSFLAKDKSMTTYLKLVMEFSSQHLRSLNKHRSHVLKIPMSMLSQS